MADSPRRRYSSSPSPRRMRSRSRSRSPGRQHRGNNDAHNPGNTLYVTGLSTRVTEKELEDHFSREGKVVDCRLVVEPRTRISRGFAFITMENVEDAERCIKYLNQSILEGRYITVEKSRRKRPRTPTPGNYLGVKSTREVGSYHDRDRRRSYHGRDGYSSYQSPHRSPYYDGQGYSPRRSPYRGGGYRRERTRSPPYSPYGSPIRSRGHRTYSDRSR
ncbi:hypothetical protein SUGI_1158970 [Cryptomeria japonica]|uniref:serine/arginine-rich splicing factor SR45a isoform X1 n=2 Tax=Cryptomeria japonica TaxID=3369 RepID=UPI0024146BFA|nr:serine/arginine-rich splicing factor SR45a isoform X1 [Cryptomeria japonica]GLJ54120.1 hypothetical protein SUGI_1158970 [Cryptomeria japonica]